MFILSNGKVKLVVDHDLTTHLSKKVTFSSIG
jgi:hypothetical protein